MCGIFASIATPPETDPADLHHALGSLSHRGPDVLCSMTPTPSIYMGCTRLKLVGLDDDSNEPIDVDDCVLICNGMIYNYQDVQREHTFSYSTRNDCESIIHLYREHGPVEMMQRLDGVFAFVLYDARLQQVIVGRDALGIRPLFMLQCDDGSIRFASESPCLQSPSGTVSWIRPGTGIVFTLDPRTGAIQRRDALQWWSWNTTRTPWLVSRDDTPLLTLLRRAVQKRMLGERPIGALLSGGIDSSVIAALVAQALPALPAPARLQTFSIGLEGSPDVIAARRVAAFIGSDHHEVLVTAQDMLDALPEVARALQTFCVTTIRASTPMYLLCKYIREHTDVKILFNGDVSDELFGSYAYFAHAPSDQAFTEENYRLIDNVFRYDVLRSDRCTAAWGLDARTPFADKEFAQYVMTMPATEKRASGNRMEKFALRTEIAAAKVLPDDIVWRSKTAFSDGVSTESNSWHTILQRHFDASIDDTDPSWQAFLRDWVTRTPLTKEAFCYASLFPSRPDYIALIGESWMPRFVTTNDPSARSYDNGCP